MPRTIDSLISPNRLTDRLTVLADCIELPVQVLDEGGAVLAQHGQEAGYCRLLKKETFSAAECAGMHLKASQHAYEIGKSYIFACHASLNHIAFPLVGHGVLLGCIIVGPFLLDEPDGTLIADLAEGFALPQSLRLALEQELRGLRILPPAKVSQISRLVEFLFTPLLSEERMVLLEKQEKLYQQSRINETVQRYKGLESPQAGAYPYEKERELLVKAKTGNLSDAKAILNDLLGYVLFTEGGRMDVIKSRALELTTLLSRVAIEGGALAERVYPLNHQFLSKLADTERYEELCYQLQEIVESFVSSVSLPDAQGGSAAIRAAVRYISQYYHQPLTLAHVAGIAGLSPSYFSALFGRVMGIHYREYVNRIRVDEAKRLLTATDYPLSQIAISVGFSDQSYFSKVFKRITLLSPNQYR